MTTEPVTDADEDGSKVMVMVHVAPAATEVQLLAGGIPVKPGLPVAVTELTVKVALPELVSITVLTVLEPMSSLPKEMLAGDRVTAGAELPVPARATDCGLPAPLEVTVIAADRLPAAAGLKVTVIVHALPDVRL